MDSYFYDRRQYNKLETVLNYISSNFVSVDDERIREVNPILKKVLGAIISAMKKVSPLFEEMYETPMYGGSFYDGLKVGKPDEFDIDLKLSLPRILNVQVVPSNEPGFVYVQLKDWDRLKKDKDLYSLYKYRGLENLKDSSNYLIQEKVMYWIQQIVAKALNIIYYEESLPGIGISFSMSGPAATLHISWNYQVVDVDLVAVFRIPGSKWPSSQFRSSPFGYLTSAWSDYFIVPKAPKTNVSYRSRCWRLSFQEQEKQMLNNHYFCKPALRLLKKLRDTRNHNIPSYFIKTIFLWKVDEEKQSFWGQSLNFTFIKMLETYKKNLDNGKIPYYWNENNNLLQHFDEDTIYNIRNFLKRMIDRIHRDIDSDPYIIAKFLLPKNEYIQLLHHFNGTEYECARNENHLYAKFEKENDKSDSGSGFTFLKFLTGAAIVAAVIFLNKAP